jgi:(1->4)-alpha-D-glucan 1-alpha-D-glucosylmutase
MKSYNPPSSTYRVQLHEGFNFKQLKAIIPYLHDLGISTIYASPIFQSTPGSMHGYDQTDPHMINPAIGTIDELRDINKLLQQYEMTWLQDIVPNHMGFHSSNSRLVDVMERGPLSPYYEYFDIDWQHPDPSLTGKLMAPFLGQPLAECVAAGEIKLDVTEDGFTVNYFQTVFPLSVSAYEVLQGVNAEGDMQLLHTLYAEANMGKPLAEWKRFKKELISQGGAFFKTLADHVNQQPTLLLQLLQQQYYQLSFWREADTKINYRRFFTVNELITLRMESPAVFDEFHTFLHSLYREGLIQGLRIDHIDGLRDPAGYIEQLRRLFGSNCYIVAEKILEYGEPFPADWALQGTSGYEFLSFANHLLTSSVGEKKLVGFYESLLPALGNYEDIVYEKKRMMLEVYMAGEWDNLVRYCYALKLADARINRDDLKEALALFMACLPVYRLYPGRPVDASILEETFKKVRSLNLRSEPAIGLLESLWEGSPDKNKLLFLQRLMQFTGPLMAKGVEDTTFYIYNALLSHNEVGDTPAITSTNFHEQMQERQRQTPLSLNGTSTHDTKRGEDARIRLNMISLLASEWEQLLSHWRELNNPYIADVNNAPAPGLNDEYFIYQSLVAGFPESSVTPASGEITDEYIERLQQYFTKAARESKLTTSWSHPDEAYEKACLYFIKAILSGQNSFLHSFRPFIAKIDALAHSYSLCQTLAKITAPGIPDIYQGCELWDYSYVDPDNRRPVDYEKRQEMLARLTEGVADISSLTAEERKLFVLTKALHFRREQNTLFLEGDYLPLATDNHNVIAYARVHRQQWVITVLTLPGWTATPSIIRLPAGAPSNLKNIFTNQTTAITDHIKTQDVLGELPLALLSSASS